MVRTLWRIVGTTDMLRRNRRRDVEIIGGAEIL
jgi:hypothetical protein